MAAGYTTVNKIPKETYERIKHVRLLYPLKIARIGEEIALAKEEGYQKVEILYADNYTKVTFTVLI